MQVWETKRWKPTQDSPRAFWEVGSQMWHQTLDPIKCLVLSNLPYGWAISVCHRCRRQFPTSPARHMWHKCESRISKSYPSWVCNGEAEINTAASMGTRQSWGMIHWEALSQPLSGELKWGIVRRWGQAWQKKALEDTLNHNF